MSESIEMYLLRIALLQEESQPVPVPRLAQELAVSPVSANEMCRKLTEKDLITYERYKGVQLTPVGEALAWRVLRHRRLWEVFFVEKLGLPPGEAEEIACRFEHVTPELLADRLDEFLEYPTFSPQHEPIPAGSGEPAARPTQPLSNLAAGAQAVIAQLNTDKATTDFLAQQGLLPGTTVQILATAPDSVLLENTAGQRLSVADELGAAIDVIVDPDFSKNNTTSPLTETLNAHE